MLYETLKDKFTVFLKYPGTRIHFETGFSCFEHSSGSLLKTNRLICMTQTAKASDLIQEHFGIYIWQK